jgi:hypothetical protein
MKDTELVNELFELWKNLGEVGELHIVKGYSDRLQMLQERVNKYNSLHNVSKAKRTACRCGRPYSEKDLQDGMCNKCCAPTTEY